METIRILNQKKR